MTAAPAPGELDLFLFAEGTHRDLAHRLGSQVVVDGAQSGVAFSVWAPNARAVSVAGGFNGWNGSANPLHRQGDVWQTFVPGIGAGEHYHYEVTARDGRVVHKSDPLARQAAAAPSTDSIVAAAETHVWRDQAWMAARQERQAPDQPISIYEVHAASWRRGWQGESLNWAQLADTLIPYAKEQGFTHIELLPVMAHPFGGSWGYQPLGLFAPQPALGSPEMFAAFVDAAHQAGLGVILDWVPGHFPTDANGLAEFDGTHLYEHADPREGLHKDWNTAIYNFGRQEVQAFLLSSALYWLKHFHIDGLRVDAVASMLYRDYSRKPGEWVPNQYGGRENLEAVAFLKKLNTVVGEELPDVLMFAEESTTWPGVSRPVDQNGLGFDYKWNMGWMNDTLRYVQQDPIHRRHAHRQITFGLMYAFTEQFVLPLSHDEVVHGKGSLLGKMPGDRWQQFANLRTYLGFMWGHPGKKLLFMGCEVAQTSEWNHDASVDWDSLGDPLHAGMQRWVRDLNHLYAQEKALHVGDAASEGFHWLVADDHDHSVFAFLRRDPAAPDAAPVVVVCNFTPVPRHQYRVGLPRRGRWRELLNSDAAVYGGSGLGNAGTVDANHRAAQGQPVSALLTLPPLSVLFLQWADAITTSLGVLAEDLPHG